MLDEEFAPYDARTVHEHLTAWQISSAFSTVKPAFIRHPGCRTIISLILQERGIDLEKLYFDDPG